MAQAVYEAMGFIETRGLIAALEAADAMLKTAQVSLVALERTDAAMMTVQITGETAAVQAAVEAGTHAARRIGEVLSSHVIARPSDDVRAMQSQPQKTVAKTAHKSSTYEEMTVRELRTLARTLDNLSIQGREIARANKNQLLDALRDRK
jgi:ethanolamine utilization protein EutM